MPQVPTTVGANDFRPKPVGVRHAFYGSFNLIIKTGPAAMAIELVLASVEGSIASAAYIRTNRLILLVLSRAGKLGPLAKNDALLFSG